MQASNIIASNPFSGLTEGRIVHYVLEDGQNRPAIVVRAWRAGVGEGKPTGTVQLQVFLDGGNDTTRPDILGRLYGSAEMTRWATSVPYDETRAPHTWHWPERAG